LVKAEVKNAEAFIKNLKPKPDVVIAVTDDQKLNKELAVKAKSLGCMVYAVDDPEVSDFTFPALARVGEVKVAISTGGKSPAMAGVLRRRVERMITEEDLLQIRLQHYIREILKKKVPDQKIRKTIVYKILENERISKLLKEKKFDAALEEAVKIVEEHQESYRLA
jgi:precorrin-2 dehydrogenase/sirohydrochlorin ferrochelatase